MTPVMLLEIKGDWATQIPLVAVYICHVTAKGDWATQTPLVAVYICHVTAKGDWATQTPLVSVYIYVMLLLKEIEQHKLH